MNVKYRIFVRSDFFHEYALFYLEVFLWLPWFIESMLARSIPDGTAVKNVALKERRSTDQVVNVMSLGKARQTGVKRINPTEEVRTVLRVGSKLSSLGPTYYLLKPT